MTNKYEKFIAVVLSLLMVFSSMSFVAAAEIFEPEIEAFGMSDGFDEIEPLASSAYDNFTFNLRDWFATDAPESLTMLALQRGLRMPFGLGIYAVRYGQSDAANPFADTTAVGTIVGAGRNRRIVMTGRTAVPSGIEIRGLRPGDRIDVVMLQPNNIVAPAPDPTWNDAPGAINFGSLGERLDMWHLTEAGETLEANNVENLTGINNPRDAYSYCDGRLHLSGVPSLGQLPSRGPFTVPTVGGNARIVGMRGLWSEPGGHEANAPNLWAGRPLANLHLFDVTIVRGTGITPPPPPPPSPRPNVPIDTTMTAHQFVDTIGPGWNLGNQFDARGYFDWTRREIYPGFRWLGGGYYRYTTVTDLELAWQGGRSDYAVTQEFIQAVYNAGFRAIRIPVTWHKAIDMERWDNNVPVPPYTIRTDWMARVRQVVEWAYDLNMHVLLNTHHEDGFIGRFRLANADRAEAEHRLTMLWAQIATEFNDDFGERLIFAGLNEPRRGESDSYDWVGIPATHENVNRLNQVFVNIVRATGGNNAHRFLVVPTYAASATDDALNGFRVPTDPRTQGRRIIMAVHTYSPFAWAHDGEGSYNIHTGPIAIRADLERVATRANALNVPVILSEWGSTATSNTAQRERHAFDYTSIAFELGMPVFWWDNGSIAIDEHGFGLFNRRTGAQTFPAIIQAIMDGSTPVTITWNPNGGSVSPTTSRLIPGTPFGPLPQPTRDNYTFGGWDTEQSGGMPIFRTSLVPSSNSTFWAQWLRDPVTITWDANGGSVSQLTSRLMPGTPFGTLPTPTRPGYNFIGWFTVASGGTQITNTSSVPDSNTTFWARWERTTVTITWNALGGSVSPISSALIPGSSLGTLPLPTLSGFEFIGWFTAASGGTQISNTSTVPDSNTTYWANWQPVSSDSFIFNLREWLNANPNATFDDLATDLPYGLAFTLLRNDVASENVDVDDPVDTTAVGSIISAIAGSPRHIAITDRQGSSTGLHIEGLWPGDVLNVTMMQPGNLTYVPELGPGGADGLWGTWGPQFDLWWLQGREDWLPVINQWRTTTPYSCLYFNSGLRGFTGHYRLHLQSYHDRLGTNIATLSLLPSVVLPPRHAVFNSANMEFTQGLPPIVVPAGGDSALIGTARGYWWNPPRTSRPANLWEGVEQPNLRIYDITITGNRSPGPVLEVPEGREAVFRLSDMNIAPGTYADDIDGISFDPNGRSDGNFSGRAVTLPCGGLHVHTVSSLDLHGAWQGLTLSPEEFGGLLPGDEIQVLMSVRGGGHARIGRTHTENTPAPRSEGRRLSNNEPLPGATIGFTIPASEIGKLTSPISQCFIDRGVVSIVAYSEGTRIAPVFGRFMHTFTVHDILIHRQEGTRVIFNLQEFLGDNPGVSFADLATALPYGLGLSVLRDEVPYAGLYPDTDNPPDFYAAGSIFPGDSGIPRHIQITDRQASMSGLFVEGLLPGDVLYFTFLQPDNLIAPPVSGSSSWNTWGPHYDLWWYGSDGWLPPTNPYPGNDFICMNFNSMVGAITGHLRLHTSRCHAAMDTSLTPFSPMQSLVLDPGHPVFLDSDSPQETLGVPLLVVPEGGNAARIGIPRGHWNNMTTPRPRDLWTGIPHPNLLIYDITIVGVQREPICDYCEDSGDCCEHCNPCECPVNGYDCDYCQDSGDCCEHCNPCECPVNGYDCDYCEDSGDCCEHCNPCECPVNGYDCDYCQDSGDCCEHCNPCDCEPEPSPSPGASPSPSPSPGVSPSPSPIPGASPSPSPGPGVSPSPSPSPGASPGPSCPIAEAMRILEETIFLPVPQAELNTQAALIAHVYEFLTGLDFEAGVIPTVNPVLFIPAVVATAENPAGANGALFFTVTVDHALSEAQTTGTFILPIIATSENGGNGTDCPVTIAREAIEAAFPAVAQDIVNTEAETIAYAEGLISALELAGGVTTTVSALWFRAAIAGTPATPDGINGFLYFNVDVSHADYPTQTSDICRLTIPATRYVPPPPPECGVGGYECRLPECELCSPPMEVTVSVELEFVNTQFAGLRVIVEVTNAPANTTVVISVITSFTMRVGSYVEVPLHRDIAVEIGTDGTGLKSVLTTFDELTDAFNEHIETEQGMAELLEALRLDDEADIDWDSLRDTLEVTEVSEEVAITPREFSTITFELNGGNFTGDFATTPPALAVITGRAVGLLPQMPTDAELSGISKEGYRFTGWFENPDDENTRWRYYTPVTGDVTLYARWKRIPNPETFRTGSINGSGHVTSADATKIAQLLMDEDANICPLAADINGDGEVTAADLTLLARWLVGHNVRDLIAH